MKRFAWLNPCVNIEGLLPELTQRGLQADFLHSASAANAALEKFSYPLLVMNHAISPGDDGHLLLHAGADSGLNYHRAIGEHFIYNLQKTKNPPHIIIATNLPARNSLPVEYHTVYSGAPVKAFLDRVLLLLSH